MFQLRGVLYSSQMLYSALALVLEQAIIQLDIHNLDVVELVNLVIAKRPSSTLANLHIMLE